MLKLDPIFASNMVFAANKPIRIFGSGTGHIEICFAGLTRSLHSVDDFWMVELPAMPYGGPYTLHTVSDCVETVLDNIYVGEVFLFAGQSNIQFKMYESATEGCDCVGNSMLRLFSPSRIEAGEPFTPADGWRPCVKEEALNWSALVYYAGQALASNGIAIGIVTCYQGASGIQSWLPAGALSEFQIPMAAKNCDADFSRPEYAQWNQNGRLYSFAVKQIAPFQFSAAVWYQGESNTYEGESACYEQALTLMIRTWRSTFLNDSLPFVVVQLADFDGRATPYWKEVQQAQLAVSQQLAGIRLVSAIDDGSQSRYIHPPEKRPLAGKIAAALKEELCL